MGPRRPLIDRRKSQEPPGLARITARLRKPSQIIRRKACPKPDRCRHEEPPSVLHGEPQSAALGNPPRESTSSSAGISRDQEDIAALFKRLRFLGVKLITVGEGEIGDLHIGLKGAMNALYLEDLADKTRRDLEGRVRAGRSGGGLCYGYDVVPGEERGRRAINAGQATIVRRIFEEFASGRSPKSIARRLNEDAIPGPRGVLWRDTAIRGHRARGTGILNNELYIGRLVRNRLRYVKDPRTGRRVSRRNDPDAWVTEDVPDLRIIDDALWGRVKAR